MAPLLTGSVLGLQVGRPASLAWRSKIVTTAIVKHAVAGPVALRRDGFEGDQQGDLRSHGGADKAVCCYPLEHMPEWERRLGLHLEPGAFGENLSVAGLPEDRIHIGDVLAAGSATVQISQPRPPCYKLAALWDRPRLPGLMAKSGSSGYYLRVVSEGHVAPGDTLELLERTSAVSVREVLRVSFRDRDDEDAVRAVLAEPLLAERWREMLTTLARRKRLPSFTAS